MSFGDCDSFSGQEQDQYQTTQIELQLCSVIETLGDRPGYGQF
jgi:hypothetical protein